MLSAIYPELLLAAGGLLLLVLPGLKNSRAAGGITLALLAAAAFLKRPDWTAAVTPALLFSGMLVRDRFAVFLQLGILAVTFLVVLSALGFSRREVSARREFYALLLFTTVGLLLIVGAQHLAFLYLGFELVSILSYLLVGFQKKDPLSTEAALKYFLFGALCTGVMLYGISLLYGLTGTFRITEIVLRFPNVVAAAPALVWTALALIAAGLAFKLALVPFHMWAPDAYEGAPTPVAAFISLGPKLAGFALFLRLLPITFFLPGPAAPAFLALTAAITMTLGNLVALQQTNAKRLLAYSSLAHAGTMLIGVAAASALGTAALLYYLVAYGLMNAGAFAGVIAVGNATGREDLRAFSGLARREPATAFLLTICLLSLAGIPPLAGFFGKMWIFAAALEKEMVWLAVVAAVNSVIALFYYVKIIKPMYLDLPVEGGRVPAPTSRYLKATLALCAFGLLVVGLWQGPWLTWTGRATPLMMPDASQLPWQIK